MIDMSGVYNWHDGINGSLEFLSFVRRLQRDYKGDLSTFYIRPENVNVLKPIGSKKVTILEAIDWNTPGADVLIDDLFSIGGEIVWSLPYWIYNCLDNEPPKNSALNTCDAAGALNVVLKYTTIDYCITPGETALYFALKYSARNTVRVLLNHGAKIYKTGALYHNLPVSLRSLIDSHRGVISKCVTILSSRVGCKDVLRMIAKIVYFRSLSSPVKL
jgi:hypothetical protein